VTRKVGEKLEKGKR
jgi:hypothetical protein